MTTHTPSSPLLQKALSDFPYPELEIGVAWDKLPDDVLDARECTFNHQQLVEKFFGKSIMKRRKKLWGWGIIEMTQPEKGEVPEVRGFFDVANADNWEKGRFYLAPVMNFGKLEG